MPNFSQKTAEVLPLQGQLSVRVLQRNVETGFNEQDFLVCFLKFLLCSVPSNGILCIGV